jgi:hypothetical protein
MSEPDTLRAVIDAAFERRAELNPRNLTPELAAALDREQQALRAGAGAARR